MECTIKGQAETSTNFGVLHGRNFKSIQLAQPLSVHILDDISLSCLFRESQSVCYVHKDNILWKSASLAKLNFYGPRYLKTSLKFK